VKRFALILVAAAGCYDPNPVDKGFKCDKSTNYLCPEGLTCDFDVGLCVRHPEHHDLGYPDLALDYDASIENPAQACGDKVSMGSLGGMTPLSAVNTAADESALAVTNDGKHIYYLSGGTLMTADLTSPKVAAAPTAVTVTGINTINGMAFASDGTLYMSGADLNGNQIFKMHLDSATSISLVDKHLPLGGCPITDIALTNGDVTSDFYVAYPLAGCDMPEGRTSYIAQGLIDKQMGAFVAALPTSGYRAPFIIGSTTMLLSSTDANPRLFYAFRPDNVANWTGPLNLNLASVGGTGKRDVAAVVSPDCKTVYFVSERSGTKGGLDLWAADVK
jgi:hypothetical protein